jgi:hypothetical protein
MAVFIAIPIMIVLSMIQTGILPNFPLLKGTADLLLLAVAGWAVQKRVQTAWQWAFFAGICMELLSSLPPGAVLTGYLSTVGLALFLRQFVWQTPIIAMFVTVFSGTLLSHSISIIALRIVGDPIPIISALELITLPSLLLNLIISIPAYGVLSDLANRLYPEEVES